MDDCFVGKASALCEVFKCGPWIDAARLSDILTEVLIAVF